MPQLLSTKYLKILWADQEIIGLVNSALFDVAQDATIEAPDPTHVIFMKEATVHGSRTSAKIQDGERTLTIPVVAEGSDTSLKIMEELYNKKIDSPLKIISLSPESLGVTLVEYDNAMLASSPNILTYQNGFGELNLEFAVGVKAQ